MSAAWARRNIVVPSLWSSGSTRDEVAAPGVWRMEEGRLGHVERVAPGRVQERVGGEEAEKPGGGQWRRRRCRAGGWPGRATKRQGWGRSFYLSC